MEEKTQKSNFSSSPIKPPNAFRVLDDEPIMNTHGEVVTKKEIFLQDQQRRRRTIGTRRGTMPNMMGEGLGQRAWGMAPLEKATSVGRRPETDEELVARLQLEEIARQASKEKRRQGAKKAIETRKRNAEHKRRVKFLEDSGEMETGFRWFYVRHLRRGWEKKWKQLVARGLFVDGRLPSKKGEVTFVDQQAVREVTLISSALVTQAAIRVPVIEAVDLPKSRQPEEWMTDVVGRKFTISLADKTALGTVFPIDWKHTLSDDEVMGWVKMGIKMGDDE